MRKATEYSDLRDRWKYMCPCNYYFLLFILCGYKRGVNLVFFVVCVCVRTYTSGFGANCHSSKVKVIHNKGFE